MATENNREVNRSAPASKTSWKSSTLLFLSSLVAVLALLVYFGENKLEIPQGWQPTAIVDIPEPPSQAVFVDSKSFNVLSGTGRPFRTSSFSKSEFFNPTSTQPPFFQVFDTAFLTILGSNASIHEIASNNTFAFAHEAPIYDPVTDQVFFASNAGGPLSNSDLEHNNQVAKISMKEAEEKIASVPLGTPISATIRKMDLPKAIQMTNGGTGPYHSNLLFINSGRGPHPPTIALINPSHPHNATILLDNYYGRQFNSLNDIKVHPSGNIFFTDVIFGYLFNFRPAPRLPSQVYRFDPRTGNVRVVATGFDKPNGIAFSPDGKKAYITDTGAAWGFLKPMDPTAPATIYVFDVDPSSHAFMNRRVFAYLDTGLPDGLQVDTRGNVYSGSEDGVHVWNEQGTLLGKFFTGSWTPNMVFAGDGRLFILSEFKIYLAHIAAKHVPPLFP